MNSKTKQHSKPIIQGVRHRSVSDTLVPGSVLKKDRVPGSLWCLAPSLIKVKGNQKGAALLTTLLILSVVLVLTTSVMLQQRLDLYRSSELMDYSQAYEYALGVERLAEATLRKKDFSLSKPINLTLAADDELNAQGLLSDATTRINLNAVIDDKRTKEFTTLLQVLFSTMSEDDRLELTAALKQWLSSPDKKLGQSCTARYANLNPPTRCAGQALQFVSELRMIEGFSSEVVQTLLPFVIALPADQETHSKNAPEEIQLVFKFIQDSQQAATSANSVTTQTTTPSTSSTAQPIGQLSMGGQKLSANANSSSLSQTTDYYLLETKVHYHHMDIHLFSLLKRQKDKSSLDVRVMRRSQDSM